jgi:uncharacterized membrane protein YgdD (TMEM256/DUF423 family)
MKNILSIIAFLGLLAVVFGAFGAHSLKEKLDPEAIRSFETGVRYMMYHVIVLLFVNTYNGIADKNKKIITYSFLAGILLFSGSIFAITAGGISAKSIWFITPLGGLFFIFGWLKLGLTFLKK